MVTKILNGANRKILLSALSRQGKNVKSIKTISRATKRSAGTYRVTFSKKKR